MIEMGVLRNIFDSLSLKMSGIGGCILVLAYVEVAFWLMAAHRQTFKIRNSLFRAVLRQDVGWFDTHDSGALGTRLNEYALAS